MFDILHKLRMLMSSVVLINQVIGWRVVSNTCTVLLCYEEKAVRLNEITFLKLDKEENQTTIVNLVLL